MGNRDRNLTDMTLSGDVRAFLDTAARVPVTADRRRGRLIFALDATASREMTWDRACHLQADMFTAAFNHGGLDVQLVFYRGFRECKAGTWQSDADGVRRHMTAVRCLGGQTQIERVLRHAIAETGRHAVDALVFVGDSLEEDVDAVCDAAGALGLAGVPAFMFQEGDDRATELAFRQVAKLTGGAYAPFDLSSPDLLKSLLAAVAVFAAGGPRALADYGHAGTAAVRRLTHQISGRPLTERPAGGRPPGGRQSS